MQDDFALACGQPVGPLRKHKRLQFTWRNAGRFAQLDHGDLQGDGEGFQYRFGGCLRDDVSTDFKNFEITVAGVAGAPFAVKARFLRHAHEVLTRTVEALPPDE